MSLPAPTSTFTIPSLHDDIELDCRIYYPRSSEKNAAALGHRFAIIAHPYATLGGSFDDQVVSLTGAVLLKHGVTLGTFNFRGARGSAGRTSWSGKAEVADYVSFYGFMLTYMTSTRRSLLLGSQANEEPQYQPRLILGGYSYGSLIASCLPPLDLVVSLFDCPREDSSEAEIKQRAEKMAHDLVEFVELHKSGALSRGRNNRQTDGASPSPKHGTVIGGYESENANRRISRDSSRRSLDTEKIRRSVDRKRQRILARTKSDQDVQTPAKAKITSTAPTSEARVVYLLISPVLPPVSGFTTMFSKPTFEKRDSATQKIMIQDKSSKDEKFTTSPTCLVWGSKDVFTSSRKVQRWAGDIRAKAGPLLCSYEIEGAGHFWIEENASQRLHASIAEWLSSLDHGNSDT